MEKEKVVKNAKEYKKKQNSYQRGLESINSQIGDKSVEMIKKLKKMPLPEDLELILEEEKARSMKLELAEKLRTAVSNKFDATEGVAIVKEDEIQGGEIHPVFDIED